MSGALAVAEDFALDQVPEIARGGQLVRLESPEHVALAMKQLDDAQIMAAIAGEVSDSWVYSFELQGKVVEGLSVSGAVEFARIRAEKGFPIRFPQGQMDVREITWRGEEGVRAIVVGRCHQSGAEGIGLAFYPWYVERKNRRTKEVERVLDDKADRKAFSVAKRNAIIEIIPEDQVVALLKYRKQLIEQNKLASAAEHQRLISDRMRNAKQAVVITADQSLAKGRESPYETRAEQPALSGEQASEEQVSRLLDLVGRVDCPPEMRGFIEGKLKNPPVLAGHAAKWIAQLEKSLGAARTVDDGEDLPGMAA